MAPACPTAPPAWPTAGLLTTTPAAGPTCCPKSGRPPARPTIAPPCIPAFADGSETAEPVFVQAEVTAGKPALPGLPAFRDGAGVETLAVTLRDAFGLEV